MEDPIQRHPTRAEQLDILVSVLADVVSTDGSVLDLGCGTGYAGHLLAARRPDIRFTGVDLKQEALDEAQQNLTAFTHPPELVAADLSDANAVGVSGNFDAVFSALTFHDLLDPAKESLIRWMAARLKPGGFVFVYDRVRLTTAETFPLQSAIWRRIEAVHGTGMRTADTYDAYIEDLDRTNRPAPLASYYDWFKGAGLAAQLLHLHGNIMLMGGAKASS